MVLTVVAAAIGIVAASFDALAQRRPFGSPRGQIHTLPNAPYDGRFAFLRLNYTTRPGGYWYLGLPAWAHGYPVAEQNLMRIMNEVSNLDPHIETTDTIAPDDPALFRYPIAYVIEPDWWAMTDREAASLGAYLEKGGFLIVDDFKGRYGSGSGAWDVFEQSMKRVVPEGRFVDLDPSQPVFHAFFEIASLANFPQAYVGGHPIFRGMFEDNDPSKRLTVVVNFNTDISQYWEWSGRGLRPFDETNEAYKLGVNYIIYGFTH